jgi:hypothetical protein
MKYLFVLPIENYYFGHDQRMIIAGVCVTCVFVY